MLDVARYRELQLARLRIAQHQVAALGAGEGDHGIHDLVQHVVQIERGVDQLGHAPQLAQAVDLTSGFLVVLEGGF